MKVVLANGCFDLFHFGHLLHLKEAARMGTRLVVSVTSDESVNKPARPVFPDYQRAAIVRALRCVDEVIVVPSLMRALEVVRPDVLVKGIDYAGQIAVDHKTWCLEHGVEIAFTDTPKYSTTDIINGIRRGC